MRTSLLALAGAVGILASGCFVTVDDDPDGFTRTYDPCLSSAECFPEDDCVEITVSSGGRTVTDGMCTHGCFDDRDCPIGVGSGLVGGCYEVGGASALCYERCDFDSDCPLGFACYATSGVVDFICLPN